MVLHVAEDVEQHYVEPFFDKVYTLLQVVYKLAGVPSGIPLSATTRPEIGQSSCFSSPEQETISTIHHLVDILYPIYLSQLLHRTTVGPDEGQNSHITSSTVKNLGMTNFIQPSKLGVPFTFSFESRKWCREITVITL